VKATRRLTCRVICHGVGRVGDEIPGVQKLKMRYEDYPRSFPYTSKLILAFQRTPVAGCSGGGGEAADGGRDILIFAMYVQEYGADCPAPNTNRTYISYLDSVRYLEAHPAKLSDDTTARTVVYHALINGYLAHARDNGIRHAHIWAEPPKGEDDYVLHCKPAEGGGRKTAIKKKQLIEWYQKMLRRAEESGIVESFSSWDDELQKMPSIRGQPMFAGDDMASRVDHVLGSAAPGRCGGDEQEEELPEHCMPPMVSKLTSGQVVREVRNNLGGQKRYHLIANLCAAATPPLGPPPSRQPSGSDDGGCGAGAPCEGALIMSNREKFLTLCAEKHWQFNEARFAHYSTMMLLAHLGGTPTS